MASTIGNVNIEAKLMLRVGDSNIEIGQLAEALTRAGIELSALAKRETAEVPESTEGADLIPAPLPGEVLFRGTGSSSVERIHLTGVHYQPSVLSEKPRIVFEGFVVDTITE